MAELNINTEKMLLELSKEILSASKVADIFNNPKHPPIELIEKLSLETALRYWNMQILYEDGDCIMNNIYGLWVTNDYYLHNYKFPDIMWECYIAFDAGEDYRENDNKSIDPAEKYTRPLVETLLKKRKVIV